MSFRALIALAILSLPAVARADDAAPAGAAPVEIAAPAQIAAPTKVEKGLFLSIGFGYLPGGIDGPGDAAAGITQVG